MMHNHEAILVFNVHNYHEASQNYNKHQSSSENVFLVPWNTKTFFSRCLRCLLASQDGCNLSGTDDAANSTTQQAHYYKLHCETKNYTILFLQ